MIQMAFGSQARPIRESPDDHLINYWKFSPSLARKDIRLLDYNTCNVSELRAFCRQRLDLRYIAKMRKQVLVTHLEQADTERTFERFMDLPAELRVQVYTLYVENINEKLAGQVETLEFHQRFGRIQPGDLKPEPPLTKISRQVRLESIPIFHQVNNFEIPVHSVRNSSATPAERFFSGATDETLANFKQLTLYGYVDYIREKYIQAGYIYAVEIRSNADVKPRCICSKDGGSTEKIMLQRVGDFEKVLKARGEKLKLMKSDEIALKGLFAPT